MANDAGQARRDADLELDDEGEIDVALPQQEPAISHVAVEPALPPARAGAARVRAVLCRPLSQLHSRGRLGVGQWTGRKPTDGLS